MDRRTALDLLELVRSDANDLRDPDFAEALAYLETDESAREAFMRQQEQDEQIAQAMQDVPVPSGLKNRLLAELEKEAKPQPKPATAPNPKRRYVLSALAVLSLGVVAAIGVFLHLQENPPELLTLHQVETQIPFAEAELAKLSPFAGEFEPTLPDGLWQSERRFTFSSSVKGLISNPQGKHRAAVYEFAFRDPLARQPRKTLRGVMVVVPKSELEAPPRYTSFLDDGTYRNLQSDPHMAIHAWSEENLVYVCLVRVEHFEVLKDVLDPPPV